MTPELWKIVAALAAGSLLTGLVVVVWLLYQPDGPGPFDADEGDV